jgi:hypothetical protein
MKRSTIMPPNTATAQVRHIGEDHSRVEIHISRPGHPGTTFEIETDKELGEALLAAGLGYEEDEVDV